MTSTSASDTTSSWMRKLLDTNNPPTTTEVEGVLATLAPIRARLHELDKDISALNANLDPLNASRAATFGKILARKLHLFHPLRVQVLHLDKQIAGLRLALKPLKKARGEALASIDLYSSILHPMRTVPDDILTVVFAYCVPWSRTICAELMCDFPYHSSLHTKHAPWTLAQVCRNWRALSISLPVLWSTCTMGRNDTRMPSSVVRGRTGDILTRSGSTPLNLWLTEPLGSITSYISPSECRDYVYIDIVPTVLASCSRWRCINMSTGSAEKFRSAFHGTHFPMLTHLSLCIDTPIGRSTIIDAPMLERINITEPRGNSSDQLHLPWDRIRHAELNTSMTFHWLARMLKLEECYITGIGDMDEEEDANAALGACTVLPDLTLLCMHSNDEQPLPRLFSRFAFPALRDLSLITVMDPQVALLPMDVFPPSLINLFVLLEESFIRRVADNVCALIQRIPTLESLSLSDPAMADVVVYLAENPGLCTRLKRLYIDPLWSFDE